jgi:hypothetical protein
MINDSELRLKLLEMVADKNPSEISEIISHAHKLYDFVFPIDKEVESASTVVDEPKQDCIIATPEPIKNIKCSNTSTAEDATSVERILNMCLAWCHKYKLSSVGDDTFLREKMLSYNMIPSGLDESRIEYYKKLIDTINNPETFKDRYSSPPPSKKLSDILPTVKLGLINKYDKQSSEDSLREIYHEMLNEEVISAQRSSLINTRSDKLNKVIRSVAKLENFDKLYDDLVKVVEDCTPHEDAAVAKLLQNFTVEEPSAFKEESVSDICLQNVSKENEKCADKAFVQFIIDDLKYDTSI